MDLTKLTTVEWIAIVGGITGLLGGITGILGAIIGGISAFYTAKTYKRDEINVSLIYQPEMRLINPLPGYKPTSTYTCLTVRNKGRRIVTITKAFYQFLKVNGGAILADSMRSGLVELKEGKSVDFLIEETKDFKLSDISYFGASDAVGNVYKVYVTKFYTRFFYWFLDKSRIKKKKKVSELKKTKN